MAGLIRKEFFHFRGNEVLHIYLPPWHCNFREYSFIKRELKKYSSYLIYIFNPQILSEDSGKTLKSFNIIKNKILKDIKSLYKKYRFKRIIITGMSLGCVNALMIANNYSKIKEIYLFDPGNCLAESMWGGWKTQNLRRAYEKQGISLKKLKSLWRSLAPENNIQNLKGKKVHVFLAKKDGVISYSTGRKLIEKMRKLRIRFALKIDKHHGHYYTIIKELIFPKDIIPQLY